MPWEPLTEREIEADAALAGAEQEEDLERPDVWSVPVEDPADNVQAREPARS